MGFVFGVVGFVDSAGFGDGVGAGDADAADIWILSNIPATVERLKWKMLLYV